MPEGFRRLVLPTAHDKKQWVLDKCCRMGENLERNANPENTRELKRMCIESGDNRKKKGSLKKRRKVLW